jgi:hypothetical protein
VPQPGVVVDNATPSLPKPAAVPANGDASRPLLHPFGMRTPAATYVSSVSTNMSAYEDLPGHHLISIRNLIASTPDGSYPGSADEGYVFVRGHMARSGTTLESAIAMLLCRFRLRRTTASPASTTPAKWITIPLESASSSS